MLFPEAFIGEIVEFCEERGIYLIMDDIYHKLVFDGLRAPSPFQFTSKDTESTRVIVVNGVSKLYGMTGLRIGWTVTSRRRVEVLNNIQSQMTSCPSVVVQAAAEAALNGSQSVVENLRLSIQNNRDVAMQELQGFRDVRVIKPQGTFYVLPDFRAYSSDSTELAHFLLDNALVVTVPGRDFGMEGHLRLSYAGGVKEVIEGIERIKWALDPESPNEIYIGDRKLVRDWM